MIIAKHTIARDLSIIDNVGEKLQYINSLMEFLDRKRNLVMSKTQGQFVEVLNTPEEPPNDSPPQDEENNEQKEE